MLARQFEFLARFDADQVAVLPAAVKALIIGFVSGLIFVVVPQLFFLASFSWGIGALVGGYVYVTLMKRQSVAAGWTERGRVKVATTVRTA